MGSPQDPAGLPASLTCQTPGCSNPIAVIVTRLEDSEADMTCMSCTMAFWAAVLLQAQQSGVLPGVAETATVP